MMEKGNDKKMRQIEKEIEYLKNNYSTLGLKELENYLDRSGNSIRHKASRLNIVENYFLD